MRKEYREATVRVVQEHIPQRDRAYQQADFLVQPPVRCYLALLGLSPAGREGLRASKP